MPVFSFIGKFPGHIVVDRRSVFRNAVNLLTHKSLPPNIYRCVLRRNAIALDRAKRSGPGSLANYDEELRKSAVEEIKLRSELKIALHGLEIVPFFQPIINLATGSLIGFEALARWQNPTRGLVLPDEFISLAEDSGLITELGHQVRLAACRQLVEWQTTLHRSKLEICVNVSTREISHHDFVEDSAAILAYSGVDPKNVVFEITESVLAEGSQVEEVLEQVVALGIRLSIDDFGTGYSSLSYPSRFPIESLKIDRSFVAAIGDGTNASAMANQIVNISKALHLVTIAEGIETIEQRDALCKLGTEFGQGYLWGRPRPAADIVIGDFIYDLDDKI